MTSSRTAHNLVASTFVVFCSWARLTGAADLQADLEAILVDEGLTGIAWTLLGEDGEVSVGSAGLQDSRSGSAFAPETRFHVGSLTKTLLATGVLRLATEERIDLDAPVLRYLPDLFPDEPPAGFAEVTVRHLLDHTAGLNDADLWQMFSQRADPDAPLAAAFPDPATQLRVRSRPGSRFAYSNMGYALAGMIIESVVGTRYETYLDENLLVPLRMRDSTFGFTTQEGENADPTLAWGHVDDGSRYAATPVFLRPAAQFTTTAADLARFAEFLLGDGVIDGQKYIDAALMRARGKPIGTEAAAQGLAAGYALGIGHRDRHGVVGYCHGGNIVGFLAMLCIFPDEHKAFAYSVNTDSETANYARLDARFVAALDIAEGETPLTADRAADISRWQGRYVLDPNRFQKFEYLDTVFASIEIATDGDFLALKPVQQDARRLRPVGGRLYSASDRATTSHVFFQDGKGEYLVSDGFRTYRKVATAYLVAHWASLLLGLAGLAWVFIAGIVSLARHRSAMFRQPLAPAFLASVLLFVPLPFFWSQSFMALGDLTAASVLLAIVTALLPVGMLLTILLVVPKWGTSRALMLHGIAAVLVLQWCAVLVANGLLPFRLWA